MMHTLCDRCGKMESVDFMVRIDDDFYCRECDEETQREEDEAANQYSPENTKVPTAQKGNTK